MRALLVVVGNPRRERLPACGGASERYRVSPLADQRLDEAFGLAVGARPIGPRPHVPDPVPLAAAREDLRDVVRPVVRQDAPDADPLALVPGESATQERH